METRGWKFGLQKNQNFSPTPCHAHFSSQLRSYISILPHCAHFCIYIWNVMENPRHFFAMNTLGWKLLLQSGTSDSESPEKAGQCVKALHGFPLSEVMVP
jgi:hypothetical protein